MDHYALRLAVFCIIFFAVPLGGLSEVGLPSVNVAFLGHTHFSTFFTINSFA